MSSRLRWLLVVVLGLLLIVAWWRYGELVGEREVTWRQVEERPTEYVGERLDLLFTEVVETVPELGRVVLRDRHRDVEARFPDAGAAGIAPGDVVSVEGRVEMRSPVPGIPGVPVLVVDRSFVHRGRRLKWVAGAVTVLGMLILVWRDLRRA